jgi:hypothetical protein
MGINIIEIAITQAHHVYDFFSPTTAHAVYSLIDHQQDHND